MTDLPDYGFVSQAMQCDKAGKYSSACWGGCQSIASLKYPDFSKNCPRRILDKYGTAFGGFR